MIERENARTCRGCRQGRQNDGGHPRVHREGGEEKRFCYRARIEEPRLYEIVSQRNEIRK